MSPFSRLIEETGRGKCFPQHFCEFFGVQPDDRGRRCKCISCYYLAITTLNIRSTAYSGVTAWNGGFFGHFCGGGADKDRPTGHGVCKLGIMTHYYVQKFEVTVTLDL